MKNDEETKTSVLPTLLLLLLLSRFFITFSNQKDGRVHVSLDSYTITQIILHVVGARPTRQPTSTSSATLLGERKSTVGAADDPTTKIICYAASSWSLLFIILVAANDQGEQGNKPAAVRTRTESCSQTSNSPPAVSLKKPGSSKVAGQQRK